MKPGIAILPASDESGATGRCGVRQVAFTPQFLLTESESLLQSSRPPRYSKCESHVEIASSRQVPYLIILYSHKYFEALGRYLGP